MIVCDFCHLERTGWNSPCICPSGTPSHWEPAKVHRCAVCGGDGIDGSHEAALFYAYSGDITNCDNCSGSGVTFNPYPSGSDDR